MALMLLTSFGEDTLVPRTHREGRKHYSISEEQVLGQLGCIHTNSRKPQLKYLRGDLSSHIAEAEMGRKKFT